MTPSPQINIPNLDGLGLPKALTDAIRQAFMYLQSLFSSVKSLQNASATGGITAYLQKNIPSGAPANTKIWVSDYQHYLVFGTYTWQFAPGDDSNYFRDYGGAPGVGSGLWHACDGTTVNYLKSDGTLGSTVLPDTVAAPAFAQEGSAYAPAISAATAPTFTGASDTTSVENTDVSVASGAGTTVANRNHTHTVTPTGTVSVSGGPPVAHYTVVRYYRQ